MDCSSAKVGSNFQVLSLISHLRSPPLIQLRSTLPHWELCLEFIINPSQIKNNHLKSSQSLNYKHHRQGGKSNLSRSAKNHNAFAERTFVLKFSRQKCCICKFRRNLCDSMMASTKSAWSLSLKYLQQHCWAF